VGRKHAWVVILAISAGIDVLKQHATGQILGIIHADGQGTSKAMVIEPAPS
jgi:hypothetical protein